MSFTKKPWGHEELWALGEAYAGKIIFIKKNQRLSLQFHKKKEETIYVLEGELLLIFGDSEDSLKEVLLKKGKSFHIKPGLIHRFCAKDKDVKLVEVSTTELDDVIRLEDDHGRKNEK